MINYDPIYLAVNKYLPVKKYIQIKEKKKIIIFIEEKTITK